MLLPLITLLGCAGLQINLYGWPAYLEPPVAINDQQLATGWASQLELLTIRQRVARCGRRWGTCWTEVRVLRNQHTGRDHLTLVQIQDTLESADIGTPTLLEQVDRHNGDHRTCFILVRVLPVDQSP